MVNVNQGLPVLFSTEIPTPKKGMAELAADFGAGGANALYSGEGDLATLAGVKGIHPTIAPLLNGQNFSPMVNALAVSRGYNPDSPHLMNVTEAV